MSNFRSAKDVYFDKIKLPEYDDYDRNSKFARAARLGLCFHCFREDNDPNRRPKHKGFAFCKECMIEMSLGVEKLELTNNYEVHKWFKD